jgi:hypothetical protein
MAGGVFDVVATLGVELATQAKQSDRRSGVLAELATREGRAQFMDEAARSQNRPQDRPPAQSDVRSAALEAAMTFHGRHDLFNAAMRAASGEGRRFEPFGDGELQRYNGLEAGRVSPSPGSPAAARDASLAQIATRDGRAALLGQREADLDLDGRGIREALRDPSRRGEVLAESEGLASRTGRPFEPAGALERLSRPRDAESAEIDSAPNRSRAQVDAMLARVDAGVAIGTGRPDRSRTASDGLER